MLILFKCGKKEKAGGKDNSSRYSAFLVKKKIYIDE